MPFIRAISDWKFSALFINCLWLLFVAMTWYFFTMKEIQLQIAWVSFKSMRKNWFCAKIAKKKITDWIFFLSNNNFKKVFSLNNHFVSRRWMNIFSLIIHEMGEGDGKRVGLTIPRQGAGRPEGLDWKGAWLCLWNLAYLNLVYFL